MGQLGRYVDGLPSRARDRVIQAQEWCLAEVLGSDGSKCLIGHAEDWRPYPLEASCWRPGTEAGCGPTAFPRGSVLEPELETLCRPELFAFRRARPHDLDVYCERLRAWGLSSESRIGSRFDRLCARFGAERAVRLLKHRAARRHRLEVAAPPPLLETASLQANGSPVPPP